MDKNELTQAIEGSLSQRQLATKFKTSQSNVRHWLKKFGLKTKTQKRQSFINCSLCNKPTKRGHHLCPGCITKIRRVRTKQAAVKYKGNKCQNCGFDGHPSAFDFHHPNDNKEFNIGSAANKSWEVVKKELDKCVMLCANCHRAKHSDQIDPKVLEEAARYKGKTLAL